MPPTTPIKTAVSRDVRLRSLPALLLLSPTLLLLLFIFSCLVHSIHCHIHTFCLDYSHHSVILCLLRLLRLVACCLLLGSRCIFLCLLARLPQNRLFFRSAALPRFISLPNLITKVTVIIRVGFLPASHNLYVPTCRINFGK